MSERTAHLLAVGIATPAQSVSQHNAAAFAVGRANGGRPFIERVYRNCGVQRRGSVLLDPTIERPGAIPFFDESLAERGPSTAERLARFEVEAGPLAHAAASQALERAGIAPAAVTHLVTVSCTGMAAPGIDCELMTRLGLTATVQRTHVGFMGCFGAIVGLRLGAALAVACPGAVVLVVCVELCSLHFQDRAAPDQAVANALFADGAAAAVVRGGAPASSVIASSASMLVPDSAGLMSWRVGEHGFEMRLDASVPARIGAAARSWLEEWLGGAGFSLVDVRSWAVHPGGPKILAEVAAGLGLGRDACEDSAAVLAAHGNMSSATVLFVAERLLRKGPAALPCVLLAFGPGLTCEALLLTAGGPALE